MTYDELQSFEQVLREKGYKKCSPILNEDWCWYKAFGRDENPYEEDRTLYQVFFPVWDSTKFGWGYDNGYGIEAILDVSRTIDDNLRLIYSLPTTYDIDEIERKAEKFFEFCEANFPISNEGNE